ncbi:MAG: recombinase family protein [Pirellulales bacterium]|nr:recombinase family protein [Pirellulales bacterium]
MTPRRRRTPDPAATDAPPPTPVVRCAVYSRKSTDEGLEKDFNSLDAQREAAEAYIQSQAGEGWVCLPDRYDDGGFTGGNLDRPALTRLLADIEAGRVDCVVVYKVDRLSRSLLDFSRIMATFDRHGVSFVSVTQSFNTSNSMGRLMLNVLLSFAQFERELISERTRDKMSAARKKGKWAGGPPLLGYDVIHQKLVIHPAEAQQVRGLFELYRERQSLLEVARILNERGWTTKTWVTRKGAVRQGRPFTKSNVYALLRNVVYNGQVRHRDEVYAGEHPPIIDRTTFEAVQDLLQQHGRAGPTGAARDGGGVLTGLLRCRHCGTAMGHSYTQRGRTRYRYYVCGRAQKRGYDACPHPSVPAPAIEAFVADEIRQIGRDPAVAAATLAHVERQRDRDARSHEAEADRVSGELRAAYAELSEAALDPEGIDRLAEIQRRIDAAQARLAELRQRIDACRSPGETESDLPRALAEFDGVWGQLTTRERNTLLKQLLSAVEFDGAAETVTLHFQPGWTPPGAANPTDLQEVA